MSQNFQMAPSSTSHQPEAQEKLKALKLSEGAPKWASPQQQADGSVDICRLSDC